MLNNPNKPLTFLIFMLMALTIAGQGNDPSLKYYHSGVSEFAKKNYVVADSFFTISLMLNPHKDSYFNRAANRQKMGNKKGYCEDLSLAALMGDQEAHGVFCKECGTVDTSYFSNGEQVPKGPRLEYRLRYPQTGGLSKIASQYNKQGVFMKTLVIETEADTVIMHKLSRAAEFPGGMKSMGAYFYLEFKMPKGSHRNRVSGYITLAVQVNKFGFIENVRIN